MRLEGSDKLQVRDLQPLSICTGASLSAYSFEDFKATLTTAKEYTCNGNFSWIDPRSNAAPGVPILASSVAMRSDANYVNVEDGELVPFHAVIAVKDIELDPMTAGATLYCWCAKKLKDLGVTDALAKVAKEAQQDDETKAKAKTKARQEALQKKRLASKLEGGENEDPPKRGKGNRKDQPKPLVENVLVPENNKPSMQDKMKSALKALKDGATKNEPQEDEFSVYDATSDGEESEGQE